MLNFCSVNDIKAVLPSAGRFDDAIDRERKAVTEEFNRYMRRTLDFELGITEFFDVVGYAGTQTYWLTKRAIVPESVVAMYDTRHDWSDDVNVIISDAISLDPAKGRIVLTGLRRPGAGAVRIRYNGGYTPKLDNQNNPTDVMNCPASLTNAAVAECVYRLDKLLNLKLGEAGAAEGHQKAIVPQRKIISGLLADSAYALTEYRKPFGAVLG